MSREAGGEWREEDHRQKRKNLLLLLMRGTPDSREGVHVHTLSVLLSLSAFTVLDSIPDSMPQWKDLHLQK